MGQDRQSLRLAGPGPDIPLQLGREQPGLIHIGGSPGGLVLQNERIYFAAKVAYTKREGTGAQTVHIVINISLIKDLPGACPLRPALSPLRPRKLVCIKGMSPRTQGTTKMSMVRTLSSRSFHTSLVPMHRTP